MAVVFRARDADGRAVAIKVLRPEIARLLGIERFLRETDILRRLSHPRIVPLLDAGQARDLPYLVMPLFPGDTLRDLIAGDAALPLETCLAVARDVGAALDHAHAQGVIHRDIKPENILMDGGRVLVTDFGLARAVETAGGSAFSSSGLVVGTPAYMSPEQADPSRHVDARADVYALGCVLYEMLTGEPPFTGASPQVVFARHTADWPQGIRVVRPDVPAHVEEAVFAALAKAPAARPSSGAKLLTLLEGAA